MSLEPQYLAIARAISISVIGNPDVKYIRYGFVRRIADGLFSGGFLSYADYEEFMEACGYERSERHGLWRPKVLRRADINR